MKKLIAIILLSFLNAACTTSKKEQFNYSIITSEIDNFWNAYDALKTSKDSVATIQELYIDKASPEFKKFMSARDIKSPQYVGWISYAPSFWETVRPLTLKVKSKKQAIDKIYDTFSKMYDTFIAPDVCFAITPIKSGGTTSKGLILIGTEIAAVNSKLVNFSEIAGFMKSIFERSKGNINHLVAHEMIHTQQTFEFDENVSLLDIAIVEGSADFIATLILGELTMNSAIYEYGEANQKELWKEFKNDLISNKKYNETDWFYNYQSGRPADLGYYIGYKIAESYYNNAIDKKRAIKEIIEMNDSKEFLKNASYN